MDLKWHPTYDELMNWKDVEFIAELDGYLYVKLPAREMYDNTIWKVDKKTHKVTYMMYTEFFTIEDSVSYVVPPSWLNDSNPNGKEAS